MKIALCSICGSDNLAVLYKGKVRVGQFGSLSNHEHIVWRCECCGVGWLPDALDDYESNNYRELVNGGAECQLFYKTHDKEQADKLRLLGTENLRGSRVVDVGAGAGSFLDLVKGMEAETFAIEPTKSYHAELARKGHNVFSYGSEVPSDLLGTMDSVVCFSTIEHVVSPIKLLKEIYSLLRIGGRAFLSTPNRDDWMLSLLPEDYGSFFYRHVHRWYFDDKSLKGLAHSADFTKVSSFYYHRFDISNFFLWLRDRKPCGMGKIVGVPPALDGVFKQTLEVSGKADYIYAMLYK